jgi:hypothetical protein
MKPQSAAIEMATVIDNPRRFDQNWIPPGQTTPSEGKYGTTKIGPWLREYAYIYSGLTDKVCYTHPLKVSKIIYHVLLSVEVIMY